MPVNPIGRLISSSSTTFVALTRDAAITAARTGVGIPATDVGRLFTGWPRLLPYTNDNSPASFTKTPPSYVWDATPFNPGETRFFAAGINVPDVPGLSRIVVDLTVFCDNAHDVRIDIYTTTGGLVDTITPPLLTDGILDPDAGILDDAPVNWLNIRYYSNRSSVNLFDETHIVVISFQAVNYNQDPPSFNPAGLAFVLDVYQDDL